MGSCYGNPHFNDQSAQVNIPDLQDLDADTPNKTPRPTIQCLSERVSINDKTPPNYMSSDRDKQKFAFQEAQRFESLFKPKKLPQDFSLRSSFDKSKSSFSIKEAAPHRKLNESKKDISKRRSNSDIMNNKAITSTGTRAGCEIHVDILPLEVGEIQMGMFPENANEVETSSTFQNSPPSSQLSSGKISESTSYSMPVSEYSTQSSPETCDESESQSMCEDSMPEYKNASQSRKKKRICLPPELQHFLDKFDLKSENIRQTVVRRFKHTMKKVIELIQKYNSIDPPSAKDYERSLKNLNKLYHISTPHNIATSDAFDEFLTHTQGLHTDVFQAKFNAKSCNDTYIENFFADERIEKLYAVHHRMACRGRLYFATFKQFKDKEFTPEQEDEVFQYCEKVPRKNY